MIDTPDPKLLEAMKEMREVLKKYDICGSIILSGPDAMEHCFEIEASWTCARVEYEDEGGAMIRIRNSDLPKDKKHKAIERTAGHFLGMRDMLNLHLKNCETVIKIFGQELGDIEHMTKAIPRPPFRN